ncbi:MAG TPA: hypothetical protein VF534_02090 [Paraburkholderia sp.]
MYQIDSSGAASSMPTPGAAATPGFFTGGNPSTGTPATILDADWFNAVMMELVNIVTAAGLPPTKGTNNQVLTAVQDLFAAIGGNSAKTFNVAASSGPNNAVNQSQVFGIGQTDTDMTSSRAFNTNYTNTTGKPIRVRVNASSGSSLAAIGLFIVGAEGSVCIAPASGEAMGISEVVLAGEIYNLISTGTVTLGTWRETR